MIEFLDENPQYFVPVFIVGWFMILSILSAIGGWKNLSENYRRNNSFEGQKNISSRSVWVT